MQIDITIQFVTDTPLSQKDGLKMWDLGGTRAFACRGGPSTYSLYVRCEAEYLSSAIEIVQQDVERALDRTVTFIAIDAKADVVVHSMRRTEVVG